MDDTSVHYESARSLVTIGDGTRYGGLGIKDRLRLKNSDREPTVCEILENAGVKLEKAVD